MDSVSDTGTDSVGQSDTASDTEWSAVSAVAARTGLGERALRRWANRGWVRSRTAQGPTGDRLELAVSDVLARAGRTPVGQRRMESDSVGQLPVPREAWERVLDQLGNLHQAGQDLAEARERAAVAETKEAFLRAQLEELRTRLTDAEQRPARRRRWWTAGGAT